MDRDTPKAFLQIFFDPKMWDEATWSGTVFLVDPSDPTSDIPGLGIGFATFEEGKKIFQQWLDRFGQIDGFEELRVSIIEGPIPHQPDGYTVFLSSNPENTVQRMRQTDPSFNPSIGALASRFHRMNSRGSVNLENFKKAYARHGRYRLFPAHVASQQIKDMDLTLFIEKKEIRFVTTSEIKPGEQESAVLGG